MSLPGHRSSKGASTAPKTARTTPSTFGPPRSSGEPMAPISVPRRRGPRRDDQLPGLVATPHLVGPPTSATGWRRARRTQRTPCSATTTSCARRTTSEAASNFPRSGLASRVRRQILGPGRMGRDGGKPCRSSGTLRARGDAGRPSGGMLGYDGPNYRRDTGRRCLVAPLVVPLPAWL